MSVNTHPEIFRFWLLAGQPRDRTFLGIRSKSPCHYAHVPRLISDLDHGWLLRSSYLEDLPYQEQLGALSGIQPYVTEPFSCCTTTRRSPLSVLIPTNQPHPKANNHCQCRDIEKSVLLWSNLENHKHPVHAHFGRMEYIYLDFLTGRWE